MAGVVSEHARAIREEKVIYVLLGALKVVVAVVVANVAEHAVLSRFTPILKEDISWKIELFTVLQCCSVVKKEEKNRPGGMIHFSYTIWS